jgi:hypothetical protein
MFLLPEFTRSLVPIETCSRRKHLTFHIILFTEAFVGYQTSMEDNIRRQVVKKFIVYGIRFINYLNQIIAVWNDAVTNEYLLYVLDRARARARV